MTLLDRNWRRLRMRHAAALALLGAFAMLSVRAAPETGMLLEVDGLLGFVERSGCDFQRNGSWYTAHKAQLHLRDKFNYLMARNRLETAEQFIEMAASESSLTGRPYMVRCSGAPLTSSHVWLSTELLRLRQTP